MRPTHVLTILACIGWSTFTFAQTTEPIRKSDSMGYFVTAWGLDMDYKGSPGGFGKLWSESTYRDYQPHFSYLGFNMRRVAFNDFPDAQRNMDSVFRGPCIAGNCDGDTIPYNFLAGKQIADAERNVAYLRIEASRHNRIWKNNHEYPGFLQLDSLVGLDTNGLPIGATFHQYLRGSVRAADTLRNMVQLKHGRDNAGAFATEMWTNSFLNTWHEWWRGPKAYQWNRFRPHNTRYRVKLRIMVDSAYGWNNSVAPELFKFQVWQREDTGTALVLMKDTIFKADNSFANRGIGWDTSSFLFTGEDTVAETQFVLYWHGNVSMNFDWLDIATAHVQPTDPDSFRVMSHNQVQQGYGYFYSGEDWIMTDTLARYVSYLKSKYLNKVNYIEVGDEPGIALGLPLMRLSKLLYDSTGGALQIMPWLFDSSDLAREYSLPNPTTLITEGVRLGWLDPALYRDIQMYYTDRYAFGTYIPLPKRTLAFDPESWENTHLPSDSTVRVPGAYYSRESYRKKSQSRWFTNIARPYANMLRATLRNPGSRYGVCQQSGAQPDFELDLNQDSIKEVDSLYQPRFAGDRPPTGTEQKFSMHMATALGSSGYQFYVVISGNPHNQLGAYLGGLLDWDGSVQQYRTYTDTLPGDIYRSNEFWVGQKERYDSVHVTSPMVIAYGDTIRKASYLGHFMNNRFHETDSLPFVYNAVRSFDDNGVSDAVNGTFTLFQEQNTTDSVEYGGMHLLTSVWHMKQAPYDTLIYIVNMLTDDSYILDSLTGDTVCGTFDRRYVSMQLKKNTLVNDIMDTLYNREVGRVRTPYVGAGDSLVVWLNPGEGILVRLMAAPAVDSFKKMQVAINLPKQSDQFLDHGTIHLDRPIQGVKNRFVSMSPETWDTAWTVPSSRYSFLGIKDNESVVMRQDSVLYRSPATTREGLWRHQNWTEVSGPGVSSHTFEFKKSLTPSTSRPGQFSTDSLAHSIVIKMDAEGSSYHSVGPVRLVDPWYIDTITYDNQTDAREKTTPFLPHLDVASGFDHQRYGGVFLKQDAELFDSVPNYSLKAFQTIKDWPMRGVDSLPPYVEWSFLHWHCNDAPNLDAPQWLLDSLELSPEVPVVFMRDSAIYTARYKRHMVAYNTAALTDTGFAWNNQRKLYFLYRDSLDRPWYRIVYSSLGRIYTAIGYRTEDVPLGERGITWNPEQLLTHWDGDQAGFPSLAVVNGTNSNETRYAYEVPLEDKIYVTKLKTNGRPDKFTADGWDFLQNPATPAIASVLNTNLGVPTSAMAWAGTDGIHLTAFGDWNDGVQPDDHVSLPVLLGTDSTNCRFPTIWMDTLMRSVDAGGGQSTKHFSLFVSWQEDTTIWTSLGTPLTKRDIKVAEFDVRHDLNSRKPVITAVTGTLNLSRMTRPASSWSQHPCITGMRVHDDSLVVRVAYESDQGPFAPETGIAVSHWRTGGTWSTPTYIYDYQMQSVPFTLPSIEIVRYFMADTGLEVKEDWYSLAFGVSNNNNLWQMALENSNTRVGPVTILGASNPQLAVTWNKADSNLEVSNLAVGQNPRWVAYSIGGYFKLAGNDTLFGYTTITELDSTETYSVQYGYGELEVDSGYITQYVDPVERPDRLRLSSTVTSDTVMRSQLFTLPAQGSLRYFAYAAATDSGYFAQDHDSIRYVLDFHDSTGSFVTRLDSLDLRDTLHKIRVSREIAINSGFAKRGYVVMRRWTTSLLTENAQWNAIVSIGRQSEASNKRTTRRYEGPESNIEFSAVNDLGRQSATLELSLPATGDVLIELLDLQGRSMRTLVQRPYRAGDHSINVDLRHLASGVYVARLQFGNHIKVARLVVVR